ncbi:MAG: YbbR-like domain-containing protein [Bacillota bacterium]
MSELLKKDTTVKIISVFFAVFLWFFVLDSSNPIGSIDLNIPLKIENENVLREKGIIIKNKNFPRNVSVTIKGRKNKIGNLGVNAAEAILDLSKIDDVDTRFLYVEVYTAKEGVSLEGVTPRTVNLELEKIGENPFPVKIVTVGKPKENYKIIGLTAIPGTVSIEATDSIINSIGDVKVLVDVNNIDKDLVIKRECQVYNKDGGVIEELNKKLSVDVKIEVAKEVPIVPVVKGRPAKNFIDGIHRVVPEKALIAGSSDTIDLIDNIKTEPIDIENLSQSMTKIVNMVVPKGVRLIDTPRSVYVDVVIEQLAVKEFTFSKDDILLENALIDNSLIYDIKDESVTISITGTKEELEKIVKEKLKPSIDVRGLGEGTFNRTMKVVLPGTVKLLQEYEVEVNVIKNQENIENTNT